MAKKAISPWLDFYATPNRRVIINPYQFPPSGSFTPLDLPNLEAWYDFSLLSGADGTEVPLITDLSGNSHDYSQTGLNQGRIINAGINGLNVLQFDGNGQYYTGAFSYPVSATWTVVAIYSKPFIAGGGAFQRVISSPGTSNDYVDGLGIFEVATTYAAKGVMFASTARVPSYLGLGVEINPGGSVGASLFGGYTGELILCRSAFSGTDESNVRAYALAKWGVTIP